MNYDYEKGCNTFYSIKASLPVLDIIKYISTSRKNTNFNITH